MLITTRIRQMRLISLFVLSIFILQILNQKRIRAEQNPTLTYQRLALLHCDIENYPAWLEEQYIVKYFLQFVKFFDEVDVKIIKAIWEKYRLQHECLKVVERHPIFVGAG